MQDTMIRKLPSTFVEKVWGLDRLPAPFPHPSDERIGEVWFEPPPELDQLLVKYIFANERLSIQAHPNDAQAQELGLGAAGKSECWVITDAEPGAKIAAGFHEKISAEQMRQASLDGAIIDLLVWHEVKAGDAFYIPAGTVHAIGGGVSLIEVQQNTDITFRLFDYGRPRELHLDHGIHVADPGPYPAALRTHIGEDSGLLADNPYFRLHYWRSGVGRPLPKLTNGPALLVPFSGQISCNGVELAVGECAMISDVLNAALSGDGILLVAQPV